jgi:5-methylcytosine-specific restriction endonuclease McrA
MVFLTQFSKNPRAKDGLCTWCKPCAAANTKRWKEANAGRVKIYVPVERKSCNKCREEKAASEFYRHPGRNDGLSGTCKQCHIRYGVENNRIKIDQYRKRWKKWQNENRDAYRATARRWFANNSEIVRFRIRRWKDQNPEAVVLIRERRRARELGAPGDFTRAQWKAVCELANQKCLACGESKPLTVDHVIPLSRGGSHFIENIQPLCQPCNTRKSDQIIDYRAEPVPQTVIDLRPLRRDRGLPRPLLAGERYCRKCNQIKLQSEFHREKKGRDGLTARCKACACESSRKYSKLKYSKLKVAA